MLGKKILSGRMSDRVWFHFDRDQFSSASYRSVRSGLLFSRQKCFRRT
jgi:hypothetical protein